MLTLFLAPNVSAQGKQAVQNVWADISKTLNCLYEKIHSTPVFLMTILILYRFLDQIWLQNPVF